MRREGCRIVHHWNREITHVCTYTSVFINATVQIVRIYMYIQYNSYTYIVHIMYHLECGLAVLYV